MLINSNIISVAIMNPILCALVHIVLTSLVDNTHGNQRIPFYLIWNNVKWREPYAVIPSVSQIGCATSCHVTEECVSVNYEESTDTCEQNSFTPGTSMDLLESSSGWIVIARRLSYPVNMTDAVAWQASIHNGAAASRAIDGNTDSLYSHHSCFHTATSNSFWAVELTHVAQLGGAVIYYRADLCCVSRTSNLRFLVSMSRADSDSGIATDVGYYEGPPNGALDNPLHVLFTPGTFGKVLRINHGSIYELSLCEIILKT